MTPRSHQWQFPLPRTHTGMLQGNGTMGVMIWGEGNTLRLTLNRADFWDHRGGRRWNEAMRYASIREKLETADKAGLDEIFPPERPAEGEPKRPSLLPLGRIELVFPDGWELREGICDFHTGQVTATLRHTDGQTCSVETDLAMDRPLLLVRLPRGAAWPAVRGVTAWDHPDLASTLRKRSLPEPVRFARDGIEGWVQPRVAPGDEPLCVGWLADPRAGEIWVGLTYGNDVAAAQAHSSKLLREARSTGPERLRADIVTWWDAYWRDVPRVCIPDAHLSFLYAYGMYKFAGLTNPAGVAAGLQGGWIEDDGMPPWSGDYHFNINVQMCYSPAYAGNRLVHLRPLFEMIRGWMPILRENARKFVGIDDGLVLPHAVDDRCSIIGAFWTGTIDHACAAWVGKMMYDCWRYGGGDRSFLRETVYPFLRGAMRVYEAMLERDAEGKFMLPVSISPEYRGAAMNAWGRNASFQLACIHWLIGALTECCRALNEPPEAAWEEIAQGLPRATVGGEPPHERILLWEGTDLEESHRHHSHLAALTPFDVIDPDDPQWRGIVRNSINHWIRQGMGLWSGWCMPWAAMIHHRVGNADMAALMLEIWRRVFTNEGHGTLHDFAFEGLTLMGPVGKDQKARREIMQMDAGMGVTSAILDGLVHTRRGVLHLFAGCPSGWREVSFSGVRVEGAFLVSARRVGGVVESVIIQSERGETLRLRDPWENGSVITRPTRAGETIELSRDQRGSAIQET